MAVISEQASALIGIQHMVEEVVSSLQRVTLAANVAAGSLLKVDDVGHGIVGTHFLLDSLFGQGRGGGGGGGFGGGGAGGLAPSFKEKVAKAKAPLVLPRPSFHTNPYEQDPYLPRPGMEHLYDKDGNLYGDNTKGDLWRMAHRKTNRGMKEDLALTQLKEVQGQKDGRLLKGKAALRDKAMDKEHAKLRALYGAKDRSATQALDGLAAAANRASGGVRSFGEDLHEMLGARGSAHAAKVGTNLMAAAGMAASPDATGTLEGSFKLLAAQVGVALVPAMAKASMKLQDLARWFGALSPEAKSLAVSLGGAAVGVAAFRGYAPGGEALTNFMGRQAGSGIANLATGNWGGSPRTYDPKTGKYIGGGAWSALGGAALGGLAGAAIGGEIGGGGMMSPGGAAGLSIGAGIMMSNPYLLLGGLAASSLWKGYRKYNNFDEKEEKAKVIMANLRSSHDDDLNTFQTEDAVKSSEYHAKYFGQGKDKAAALKELDWDQFRATRETELIQQAIGVKAGTVSKPDRGTIARERVDQLTQMSFEELQTAGMAASKKAHEMGQVLEYNRTGKVPSTLAGLTKSGEQLQNIAGLAMHLSSRATPSYYSADDLGRSIQLHALGDSPLQEEIRKIQLAQLDALLEIAQGMSEAKKQEIRARAGA